MLITGEIRVSSDCVSSAFVRCDFLIVVYEQKIDVCLLRILVRLNEYNCNLRSLKSRRDALYSKLTQVLVAKVHFM